jgi:nicotinate-nucleotide adenylyltransferase
MLKKKIGLMCGTFNPIHNGHLLIAQESLVQYNLDEIFFVPSNNPTYKNNVLDGDHRYNMIQKAIKDNSNFKAKKIDIDKGFNYAIETINYFTKQYCNRKLGIKYEFYFIIGVDSLLNISLWKTPHKVFNSNINFIVSERNNYNFDELKNTLCKEYMGDFYRVTPPQLPISSTKIRQRVKDNKPIKYLTQTSVKEYINNFNLYK